MALLHNNTRVCMHVMSTFIAHEPLAPNLQWCETARIFHLTVCNVGIQLANSNYVLWTEQSTSVLGPLLVFQPLRQFLSKSYLTCTPDSLINLHTKQEIGPRYICDEWLVDIVVDAYLASRDHSVHKCVHVCVCACPDAIDYIHMISILYNKLSKFAKCNIKR